MKGRAIANIVNTV